ncbi:MAG TPA: carboxypeptidase-like regulatory domain-containing protein [Bacteroidota bacterium]|nr:carboxypeptidase-like regulatory domain-containing protein [Bacteroidota bacterium]
MKKRSRFAMRLGVSVLFIVGVGMWVASCSKNNSMTGPGGGGSTSSGPAKVVGVVNDASTTGNPVLAGATVQIVGSSTSTTTDANGAFSISVPTDSTKTINISKTGYSLNQVVVTLKGDSTRNITVSLLKVGGSQSVPANAGGSVADTKSNAVITLPPNFVSASGNVTVTVTGLDPTTDQVRALPGGLQAVDATGNTVYLQPVSFAEYTVTDANGNVLPFNTSAGSGANIELPIPASLRGKPGYRNGDPIECYLYDPSDGKWKTPVPGVIGPSSVDASIPAIKATIMHLSWYGGAPAVNQRACIKGYVKNSNGTPAAGAEVDLYPGANGSTDKNGYFDLDASPSSNVRIVATVLSGSKVSTAEEVVYTGSAGDSCYTAPDLTLGLPQQGNFQVNASLYHSGSGSEAFDYAIASIQLTTPDNSTSDWDSAAVQIGYGSQFTTLTPLGGGSYYAFTGSPANFALTPGEMYQIKIDFDKNGTIDAEGSVRMVGVTAITNPADNGTVPKTFTATWVDSGATHSGYSANYWGFLSGDSTFLYFLTTNTQKVIGDNTIDSSFWGYPQVNSPLPAGSYSLSLWSFNGPGNFLSEVGDQLPNISGQNVTGYFYSYYFGTPVNFTSSGTGSGKAAGSISRMLPRRTKTPPLALKNFFKHIPASIRKKAGISLARR